MANIVAFFDRLLVKNRLGCKRKLSQPTISREHSVVTIPQLELDTWDDVQLLLLVRACNNPVQPHRFE